MTEDRRTQSGISLTTLLIAAAASATAAYVVPMFWKPGTVFAAAMTPIIVTVVSELLKRPTEKVSTVTSRRTRTAGQPFDPLAPAPTEELEALPQTTTTRRAVHRRRGLSRRQWALAVGTGLVAFVVAVTFVTGSELLAGERVGSDSNPTTFFGGEKQRAAETPTPTATPAGTATATPTPTPTSTPSATPTPAPTDTPPPAVPAPQSEPESVPESAPPASPVPTP